MVNAGLIGNWWSVWSRCFRAMSLRVCDIKTWKYVLFCLHLFSLGEPNEKRTDNVLECIENRFYYSCNNIVANPGFDHINLHLHKNSSALNNVFCVRNKCYDRAVGMIWKEECCWLENFSENVWYYLVKGQFGAFTKRTMSSGYLFGNRTSELQNNFPVA